MAYEFSSAETAAEALTRCAREQLDRAIGALTEDLEADPVTAVHAARKAIKKERALLRLARGLLDAGQRRAANLALREAARRLSGLRDSEVMLQAIDGLSERYVGQLPEATFAAIRERLELERDAERARAGDPATVAAVVQELAGVKGDIDSWRLRGEGREAIGPGVARTYRDGRRAGRRARREPSLENLHEWRKRVKDLWYEMRLLAPVCGPIMRGHAQEAEQLAELLGEDHDLGVLRQTIIRAAPELAVDVAAPAGLIDYRRAQLQTQARCIGVRLYAEGERRFSRRVKRYWKAGAAEFRAFEESHPGAVAQAARGQS